MTIGLDGYLLARLKESCDVRQREAPRESPEEFGARLASVEGLLCTSPEPITAEGLAAAAAGGLRVVSTCSVGFDHIDVAAATRHGIVVCNTPDVLTAAVADLTMGLLLAGARRIAEADRFVRAGRWGREPFGLAVDLAGKTLGIVGWGRIGRAVAERARPFGLRVIYCDVIAGDGDEGRSSLEELLATSDFVSLHVNLQESTRGLIGARELGLMKPGAWLINTARGPVLDWGALREALLAGRIAGAALDVTDPEPPAADDPLLQLPNVLVTPHLASGTMETRRAMAELAVTNLLEALSGRRPPCMVNPEAWRVG